MADFLLETMELTKTFGALMAVDAVSLGFEAGQVHAVIGPNGAGKTTFINLLSGELTPSGGGIRFKGRDITGTSPEMISRLGVGRSYQKTNIFPKFTCFENCRLAAQSRLPGCMGFFRPASGYREVNRGAEEALELCGLSPRRDIIASAMSYGEQRQLEIGMMLATKPELLLLDEPLAGMGPEESRRVLALLARLAEEHTLILVEHDMDAVFSIAHDITVLDNGSVLERGSPEVIRTSALVQQAYLGTGDHWL